MALNMKYISIFSKNLLDKDETVMKEQCAGITVKVVKCS